MYYYNFPLFILFSLCTYIIVFWKGIIKKIIIKKERAERTSQSEFTWDHVSRSEPLLGRKVSFEHLRVSKNIIGVAQI